LARHLTNVKADTCPLGQMFFMSSPQVHAGRSLERLTLWWRNKRSARRALCELNRSPYGELARTARDLGVNVERLGSIAARGPLGVELMPRMAKAQGLGPDALRRADCSAVREMEERCTFCGLRFRCALDLMEDGGEDGGAARARAYCPNAQAFKALRG